MIINLLWYAIPLLLASTSSIIVILPCINSRCFYNLGCFFSFKKGYKLTRQGKSMFKMGWRQVTSERQGGKMLSTMEMQSDSSARTEIDTSVGGPLLFERQVIPYSLGIFLFV